MTLPYVNNNRVRLLAALFALCVLGTAPSAAQAGNGLAPYKAKGIVVAKSDSTVTVCVGTSKKSTNKRAKPWQGEPVVFDFTAAHIKVRDTNSDGSRDAADIDLGNRVKVGSRLPKVLSLASSPFPASKIAVDSSKKIKPKKGYDGGSCPFDDDEADEDETVAAPSDDGDVDEDPWFGFDS